MRTEVYADNRSCSKTFSREEDFNHDLCLHHELADAGLSPQVLSAHYPVISLVRCVPLLDWMQMGGPAKDLSQKLLGQVRALHGIGYCHRALCPSNLVVRNRIPLFVGLHSMVKSDDHECYDLKGPDSGVSVPQEHTPIGGIWWGSGDNLDKVLGKPPL